MDSIYKCIFIFVFFLHAFAINYVVSSGFYNTTGTVDVAVDGHSVFEKFDVSVDIDVNGILDTFKNFTTNFTTTEQEDEAVLTHNETATENKTSETKSKTFKDMSWSQYHDIRLPKSLWPALYEIAIKPDIYQGFEKGFSYQCQTTIFIYCKETTDVIRLHSLDHQILSITITNLTEKPAEFNDTPVVLHNYILTPEHEMLHIYSETNLTAGQKYRLEITSMSNISGLLRGLFYCSYKEKNETKYIFTTMMEPTDARRVFPNFDEPDFKAVFTFRIKRKEGHVAITNLPKRTTIEPDGDGYFEDIFDSPNDVPMSSYLVAMAIGELGYLESTYKNITFRTYSRIGAVNQTRHGLEVGVKFLEYFENYFKIPYSLPKEDMLAIPTMTFAGMEHWGLITYREETLLYEEGVSSSSDLEWTSLVIAHEIAHQWFGNLVSPSWWDDLWLNEGFATYMMYLALDRLMPEWKILHKLIVDQRGIQNAMHIDDTNMSHPVYQPVHNPVEINNIFDLISYAKGCAVIRMMNFFLGDGIFQRGLTRFLKKFSNDTATHDDLWRTLSEQAKEENHQNADVKSVMDTWLLEENYPLVTITRVNNTTILLTQTAFLKTKQQRYQRRNILWKIPFVYTTSEEMNFEKTHRDMIWLQNRSITVTDECFHYSSWIIANVQLYGFYRVNYERDNWYAIFNQLQKDHTVIHPINRAQIINDAWNLAMVGLIDFDIALNSLNYLESEMDYVPWKAAQREFNVLGEALQLFPAYGRFKDFMKDKLKKTYIASSTADKHQDKIQHSMIASEACRFGLKVCIDNAQKVFNIWRNNETFRVNPDIKDTVYCTGVEYGGYDAWNHVLNVYRQSESTSEKKFLLESLACINEPWLVARLFKEALGTDTFSKTDIVTVIGKVASRPAGRLMTYVLLDEYWHAIQDIYGHEMHLLWGLINGMTRTYNTRSELNMLNNFLESHSNLGIAQATFTSAIENIRSNIQWIDKYYAKVDAWLM